MPYQSIESLDPERLQNAEETLCKVCGLEVEAGQNLLKGFHTILDVPTGAGKTLAFWYPLFYHIGNWEKRALCTKCLLLIGPLTALLKFQQKTLENVGIPAVCLNSEDGNMEEEMEVCIVSYSSMS
jgi:superfamily II DNA helicase RecQ